MHERTIPLNSVRLVLMVRRQGHLRSAVSGRGYIATYIPREMPTQCPECGSKAVPVDSNLHDGLMRQCIRHLNGGKCSGTTAYHRGF